MAKHQFAALTAAAIDGRTSNIFYRQTQLLKLHQALVGKTEEIVRAIVSDSGSTRGEAQVEYSLALTQLRERYAELDPKKELEEEYLIANGKNAADLRTGVGIVLIKAHAEHTLFYSVIAPLSAALAAGNCVIVQIENNLRSLPTLLKTLLKGALDSDTFDIVQQSEIESAVLDQCLQVDQSYGGEEAPSQNQLASHSNVKTAAIVDRTADLDKAAEALVNARFAFKGRSPYAPDVVLVNEFVKKDFLQALLRHSVSIGEGVNLENGALEKQKSRDNGLKDLVSDLQRNGDVRVIAQESGRAIVDVRQRSSKVLLRKTKEACLIVHSVRSLDDAIDFLNGNGKELLAAYHWAAPAQCKYLGQFVSARVSFVNHIPADLLVGPAFPASHSIDPSTRYPTTLFSKPAPAFITPSSKSQAVEKALLASSSSEKANALRALQQEAKLDLPAQKRGNKTRAAFGFFEQAMLMNLGVVLITTASTIAGGVYLFRHARIGR